MGHSIYFLTATWLAAQGMEPQAMMPGMNSGNCSTCQNGGMGQQMQPMGGMGGRRFFSGNCQSNPGIFQRMGNRFRGFVDRCLGEDDQESSTHNNMQHMNNMQHNNMQNMSHMRQGQGNFPQADMNASMPTSIKMSEPPLAEGMPGQNGQKAQPKNLAPITFRPHGGGNGNFNGTGTGTGTGGSKSALSARMADKVGHENDFSWITGQLRRETGGWAIHFATAETIDRYNGRLPIAAGADMSKFQDGDLVTAHGQVNTRGAQPVYQTNSVDLIEHDAK